MIKVTVLVNLFVTIFIAAVYFANGRNMYSIPYIKYQLYKNAIFSCLSNFNIRSP